MHSLTFDAPQDWHAFRTDLGSDLEALPILWIANVPFFSEDTTANACRTEASTGIPRKTLDELPEDGVVIVATGPRLYTGEREFPVFRRPLRTANAWRMPQGRAAANSNLSRLLLERLAGDDLLSVSVWFGAQEPDAETLARADGTLALLDVTPI